MSTRSTSDIGEELAVDSRLIMPETRYEVIDGEVVHVSPSDQPHGSRHSKVSALLEACTAEDYDVASDMLTRTSEKNDFAPDASVYPAAPHPKTGGRQLEELAFEVVSTQSLSKAGAKAVKLLERGVRRVFAIDVERQRGLEWSRSTATWEILGTDAVIEDRCLAAPLCVRDLVGAVRTDDAVARALLDKDNPVLRSALDDATREAHAAGHAAGRAEAVLAILRSRGMDVDDALHHAIRAETDEATLGRWLDRALRCEHADELLEG